VPDSESVYDLTGPERTPSEQKIAEIAGRQFGAISLAQLLEAGLTYREVMSRVKRGYLHRLYRGVYAVGHRNIGPQGRLIAALLAFGDDAFLSHRTSAGVWGLRPIATKRIEVTVPGPKVRLRRGLVVHRTRTPPDAGDLAVRNGLRVSSVSRMLIELAVNETPRELDRLITQSVRKQIFDLRAVEAALVRHERRPGVGKLKAALQAYRPREDRKSDLERAFDRSIVGTDIPPPLRNVQVDVWEIDCLWPEQRLALELDGRPYHVAVMDTETDRIKDAKLMRLGLRPLRITDLRFRLDRRGALDDIRALLGIR
jgi:very-short-patch-repair endonuclease